MKKKSILSVGMCIFLTACSAVEPVQTVLPVETTVSTFPPVTTIAEIPLQTSEATEFTSVEISSTPINPNVSDSTKEVLAFLTEQYGQRTLSGQYISSASAEELTAIEQMTGRKPAILMADLGDCTKEISADDIMQTALDWGRSGGLVSLMWHWKAPIGNAEVYSEKTDFNLSNAVTKDDISQKTLEELEELQASQKISQETFAVVQDIDSMAKQLQRLNAENIPVLWRPLHEASGGWFWWGKDKAAYQWLWKLMYDRLTGYHHLNNLLWVWNGQAAEWYVGDDLCDIVSADVYTQKEDYSSQLNLFKDLSAIAGDSKLTAISECGCLPDVNSMYTEGAAWSYFGLWYGEYLPMDGVESSQGFNSKEQFVQVYNSEGVLTLDELPSFLYAQ